MRIFPLPHLKPFLATCLAAVAVLAVPASANAMIIGLESNSEFVNSDRTPALQANALDKAQSLGAQVIRANVNWSDVARNCGGQTPAALTNHANPCYSWGVHDSFVQQARERGISVLFSVSQSPQWVNGSSDTMFVGATSVQFNRFVTNFTAFMTAIGTRYNASSPYGEVRMWTIWNEPNSGQFWRPFSTRAQRASAPLRYAALYAKAAVALRATSRRHVIAPGPTGPAPRIGLPPATFIAGFQKHVTRLLPGRTITAKRSYLNAVAHNPYPYVRSPRPFTRRQSFTRLNYPNLPIQRTGELVRLLDRAPITRGRLIWATEFGYETYPQERLAGVSRFVQGRWMADAFDVLGKTGRVSVAIWYGMTDPTNPVDWQSGSFYSNGKLKPAALWQRRPVAVNATRVRRGGVVEVWGRSNIFQAMAADPTPTTETSFVVPRLQFSTNNGRSWRTLFTKRRSDGSFRVAVRVRSTMRFAIYDGVRGPSVTVVATR